MKYLILGILLLIPASIKAALPDTITDPATRDAVEYLDGKLEGVLATIATSSATLGTPSSVVPITLGGTNAITAPAARANLGVPSLTGDGATGTWNIAITGSVANATNATFATSAGSLANAPTTCSVGQASVGILANGNATGCFTPFSGTATTDLNMNGFNITGANNITAAKYYGDASGLTNVPGGAGVLQLDADGNITPDDLVIMDSLMQVVGNDIMPL